MRLAGQLLVLAFVAGACGKPSPKPDTPITAPAPAEPTCAPEGEIRLPPDHRLHCRDLPFEVTFPGIASVTRQNDRAMTMYSAKLERGAMLVIAEPRTDSPDAAYLGRLLETLVKGISADATVSPTQAPTLSGATVATAYAFTTPDGGAGIVRGYFANHWLIAQLVGARLPEAETRPDKPAAKDFLASIKLRPLPTGTRRHQLADGAYLDLPASAWATGKRPAEDGVRSEVIHLAPDRGVWIGVRELEMRDRCDYLKGAVAGPQDDIAERLKTIYSNAQNPLAKIERGKLGDVSVYAEADSSTTHVVMYLICAGKTVVQLTVAGDKPNAELRPHLDEVAKTLVGAK